MDNDELSAAAHFAVVTTIGASPPHAVELCKIVIRTTLTGRTWLFKYIFL